MICPSCKANDSRVVRTMKGYKNARERNCPCGTQWETTETINRGSVRSVHGVIRTPIPVEIIREVLARDGGACRYCGVSDGQIGIDHVVPLCAPIPAGATRESETAFRNSVANLVACCSHCNSAKGDRVDGKRMSKNYEARRILAAANSNQPPLLGTTSNGQSRQVAANSDISSARGVGGVLSGDLNSVQDSGSAPIPTPVLEASGSGARARKTAAVVYSPHFAVFWDSIGSTGPKGSKAEAQAAWEAQGRPGGDVLINKWNEYLGSCGEQSPKHVCRWLKYGMHVQEYNAPIRAIATRPVTAFDKTAQGHQQMFKEGRAWATEGK